MSTDNLALKTVAVLGGSYGGSRAAHMLAADLPSGWHVVLVDRNSHFNHVYSLPRYAVLAGHEHKAFIPYDNLFNNASDPSHAHIYVHGTITSLHPHHITYTPHAKSAASGSPAGEAMLHFDYAIYALGSHLPAPINLWGSHAGESRQPTHPYVGTKQESMAWLRSRQQRIESARRVLVVGGGALGIQFAADIAAIYPHKSVTLLHSRSRLLPRFDEALGDEAHQGLQELGANVIFNERLDMASLDDILTKGHGNQEAASVKTTTGRDIDADLVLLCTGLIPNTSLLHTMDPDTIDPKSGMIRVSRTMQILALREQNTTIDQDDLVRSTSPTLCGTIPPSPANTLVELDPPDIKFPAASAKETCVESESDASCEFVYPHLFAIGDAVDAFGAIKAGHTAYYQGEVAARNVMKLIQSDASVLGVPSSTPGAEKTNARLDAERELEAYTPGLPMIKVSLGLTKLAYQVGGVVDTRDDGTDDLGAAAVWGMFGYRDVDEEDMWV